MAQDILETKPARALPVVSIGLPIYKRLEYLPNVLRVIAAQDYPAIDLIVSDNGVNGSKVREIVDAHYSRPYRFRQNQVTVGLCEHFNQLINFATGEYYMTLADDDEISPNYVSTLVGRLEERGGATFALALQQSIDVNGVLMRQSNEDIPPRLSGADFIQGTWEEYQFGFDCFSTFLAKTSDLRACGGYPNFLKGYSIDNALLVKLSLKGDIVFSSDCAFRWRVDAASYGWSVSLEDMTTGTLEFLRFLKADPLVQKFAAEHPLEWNRSERTLVRMAWQTYWGRLNSIYKGKLSRLQWLRAAFALPYTPDYYKVVIATLIRQSKSALKTRVKSFLPS
jgi:glycosyltransferase involved in cell wall biosynthesis